MSGHRLTTLLLVSLVGFGLAGAAAAAKIYKWVDENGVVQYSQQPPPQGTAQEIIPPPPPAGDPGETRRALQERLEQFEKRREERARAEQESAEERVAREKRSADCKRISENLQVLESNPRVLEERDDGTRVRLSEEERQAKIELFNRQLTEECN